MISLSKKVIWVGINGTGTTSMAPFFMRWKAKATSEQPNQKHQTYVEAEADIKKRGKSPDDFFKFTFIRNPWDRQVGRFFHDQRIGDIPPDVSFERWIKWFDMRYKDKGGFDRALQDETAKRPWCFGLGANKPKFLPRWDWPCFYWCCNEDMEIKMDFIGRVETLEKDFDSLTKKLDINASLPHKNKSDRGPYQDYFTKETKDVVEKIFEKDIEHFGYTFD
jgi:hypothetical protein